MAVTSVLVTVLQWCPVWSSGGNRTLVASSAPSRGSKAARTSSLSKELRDRGHSTCRATQVGFYDPTFFSLLRRVIPAPKLGDPLPMGLASFLPQHRCS